MVGARQIDDFNALVILIFSLGRRVGPRLAAGLSADRARSPPGPPAAKDTSRGTHKSNVAASRLSKMDPASRRLQTAPEADGGGQHCRGHMARSSCGLADGSAGGRACFVRVSCGAVQLSSNFIII
jgi:hypothetical protein